MLSKKLFWILILIYACSNDPKGTTEKITPLTNSWEFAIPHQEIPKGIHSLKAADCGSCHKEHYNEWLHSTHAHAWTDKQFQAELKKESSPFMCINCHIPLQNQQEYIIKGLKNSDIYQPIKEKNPHFDKELQQEGINCASCHVRNGAIIGPTGTNKAPHKTVVDTNHLSEQLCINCHNAVAVVTKTLACSFETGDEWKAGPYYKKQNCISCHMPKTHRSIVAGYNKRKSRFHFFAGSGIPKEKGAKTKALNGLTFNTKNKTNKDSIKVVLSITNSEAGHKVPTGDPERFYLINFYLTNYNNDTIDNKQYRIGEQWKWYPEAKKINDNNLLPLESRNFNYSYFAIENNKTKLFIKVTKHRISTEAAEYNKLGDDYPQYIVVYQHSFTFN